MKALIIATFTLLTFSASAQVIDTIGPKSNPIGTRGPRNQNTDPVVKPTYTDTVKRQVPGSMFPTVPSNIPPQQPGNPFPNYTQPYNPTAPSVPPTQTNPTSPATPVIPGRSDGTPPGLQ